MATPKSISKMRTMSRVCKLSAWVIGAIGIVVVVIYVPTTLPIILYFRQQGINPYAYSTYTSVISTLFILVVPTLFFTVVLYALGILMEYMTGETKPGETVRVEDIENDDERLEIVPIPEMR